MAMTKQIRKNDCIILSALDELVPKDHLIRKLDNCIGFRFIEDIVNIYIVYQENQVYHQ